MTDPGRAEIDLAEAVAAAALNVPGVSALHAGMFGEVATYRPGRRLPGVRVDDAHVDVHVVMRWGHDVRVLAKSVQDAVGELTAGRSVSVTVEDIAVDPVGAQDQDESDQS